MTSLGDLAHVRTGDKGDTSQIAVIAYDSADYSRLARGVTIDRLLAHLPGLSPTRVERFELPGLGALNFVLHAALGGGVTRSLALDGHGKCLGAQLVDLPIEDPEERP